MDTTEPQELPIKQCGLKSCSKSFYPRLPSQLYCEPAHGARARIERLWARKAKKMIEMIANDLAGIYRCPHRHKECRVKQDDLAKKMKREVRKVIEMKL